MADTLPPEVLAKLERSAQALGGSVDPGAVAPDHRDERRPSGPSEPHPLVWTNTAYVRRPLGPGEGGDAIHPVAPAEVAVGWSLIHASRLDTDASGGDVTVGRTGVVYDVTPAGHDAETGETLPLRLHAAALPIGDGSRQRGPVQLDAAWPDEVESAQPATWAAMRAVLGCAYRELAMLTRRRHLDPTGEERRDWLLGMTTVLDGVRRERGWR